MVGSYCSSCLRACLSFSLSSSLCIPTPCKNNNKKAQRWYLRRKKNKQPIASAGAIMANAARRDVVILYPVLLSSQRHAVLVTLVSSLFLFSIGEGLFHKVQTGMFHMFTTSRPYIIGQCTRTADCDSHRAYSFGQLLLDDCAWSTSSWEHLH